MNSVKYFTPKNWCADICKAQFLPSNLSFTLKTFLLSNAISSFFSSAWSIFSPYKRLSLNEAVFTLFFTFIVILVKFSAQKSSNFFLLKIWDIRNSKRAAIINWWIFWIRNGGLLLPFFCSFLFKGRP